MFSQYNKEQGKLQKLSQPWHGTCRVLSHDDPDTIIAKMYFSDKGTIQVHQFRVCICPIGFPPGYYWYCSKHLSDGTFLRWIQCFQVDQSPDVEHLMDIRHHLKTPLLLPRNKRWTLNQRDLPTATSCVPAPPQIMKLEINVGGNYSEGVSDVTDCWTRD